MDPLDPKKHATPFSFFFAVNKKVLKFLALSAFFYSIATVTLIVATYFLSVIVDDVTSPLHLSLAPYLWGIVAMLIVYEVGFRIGHIFEIVSQVKMRRNVKRTLLDHTASLSFGTSPTVSPARSRTR